MCGFLGISDSSVSLPLRTGETITNETIEEEEGFIYHRLVNIVDALQT